MAEEEQFEIVLKVSATKGTDSYKDIRSFFKIHSDHLTQMNNTKLKFQILTMKQLR